MLNVGILFSNLNNNKIALYGSHRDINLFKSLNKELLHDIIEQKIGYYKPKLDQLTVNTYGESTNKFWNNPVLLNCLIERGEQVYKTDDLGPDFGRSFRFRFLKDDLKCANVLAEVGDVVLWGDDYYESNSILENQMIVGKNPDYSYSNSTDEFGSSWSIIVVAHLTRVEKLGIKQDRL